MPKDKKKLAKFDPLQEADQLFDKKEYEAAEIKYEQIAQLGNGAAKNALGILAMRKEQYEEAFHFFHEASALDDADGHNNLAYCYENGVGTEVSIPHTIYFLFRAVSKRKDNNVEILQDYLQEFAQKTVEQMLVANASEYTGIIESQISQALVVDPFRSAFQILKHPSNRKIVVDILRLAQKMVVKNPSVNALPIVAALFRFEFTIHDFKIGPGSNEEVIWDAVFNLVQGFKQYQDNLIKGSISRQAIFQSIIKKSKIAFLTREQRDKIHDEFLIEIVNPDWNLSSACQEFAKQFAPNIKGGKPQVDILEILDSSDDLDKRVTHAIMPRLPNNQNGSIAEIFNHPENVEIVKNIINENVSALMSAMSIKNAIKLIALLEFKEKIFGLDIAPLFFMKILHDLNLVCENNLQWLLDHLEDVDCKQVDAPSGIYTILDKIVLCMSAEVQDGVLQDLSKSITNMVTAIHATPPTNILWKHARTILADYRMALIGYTYNRSKIMHPIVEVLLKEDDLSKPQTWRDIFMRLPKPPQDTDRLTFTSDAIWFAATCADAAFIDLKEQTVSFKKKSQYLMPLIESYDAYLLQLERGSSSSKRITEVANNLLLKPKEVVSQSNHTVKYGISKQ